MRVVLLFIKCKHETRFYLLDSILRARLVYEDPIKLWHDLDRNEYAKVLKDVTKPISLNNGQAFIWTKDDTLYLTFRGTYDINDVWTGLEFYQVKLKDDTPLQRQNGNFYFYI